MMEGTPISSGNHRPILFKQHIPPQYLKDYFQHVVDGKMLYIIVMDDVIHKIFIRQEDPKQPGFCHAFWRKRDASVYAASCSLPKDKFRIWETKLDDVINFAKKMHDKNEDTNFNVYASIFHNGVMIDVDLIWSKDRKNMI